MQHAPPALPPGWQAQWHEEYQRYSYVDPATGIPQWEEPTESALTPTGGHLPEEQQQAQAGAASGARGGGRAKRAYAASDMYYGAAASGGAQAPATFASGPQAQAGPGGGGGFFSPAATAPGASPDPYAAAQTSSPYLDASNRGDLYGAGLQQQQQGSMPVNAMAQQFGNMGFGGATQQQPQMARPIQPINLTQTPTNPLELLSPPPEPLLPPNSSFSMSPYKNADVSYQRCTMNAVPTTSSLLNKSKAPFSLVCTPYRTLKEGEPEVPVVNDFVIARCRRCRTYINPYVTFLEGGNRWKCCMCNLTNDVPQMFDYDQHNNCPADRWQRPELNHGVVDFVAPTEYMVRPPQPPYYVFVFDVSHQSVSAGVLATAARVLRESLDRLPNKDGRTKVAIIGMDAALHFFKLTEGNPEPTVQVVGDLDDVFLPSPTDLLVNLTEAREGLENLLTRLFDMYKDTISSGCALGPALQAAYQMISNIGGKVILLSANLPNAGPGALKVREDPKLYNTAKESTLLQPATDFYKKLATDCSRQQVSVDMWLFSSQYADVATLSTLPKYTGGQTYYYKAFSTQSDEDALKFAHEFAEVITQPFLLEAVLRVRASRGLRMAAYHGNAFVRSTDLLALSAVSHDQAYSVEVQIEDPISAPFVVFQTAVLHTTSFGERRIRVVTSAFPTTTNMAEIYASLDQVALATFLSHKAVERSLSHKLEDARDALTNKVVELLTVYKNNLTSSSGASPHLSAPESLKYLPLLVLGLLKHVAFRQSGNIASDFRAYAQALLTTLPPDTLIPYIHPSFYSLHNMPRECGTVGENGVVLPPPQSLTSERLERHGLHLIEDGQVIFLWVGREAVPQLVQDVFDVPTVQDLHSGKRALPLLDNEFSQRVNAIIGKIRESRKGPYYPLLYVVREDGEPSIRMWALSLLIEDRTDGKYSYPIFLNAIKDKVNGG